MTHRDGFPRFSARNAWHGDAGHCKPCAPDQKHWAVRKPWETGRSGRAGEPAAGESVGASESLDDVPHRPRLPCYPPVGPPGGPTDRLPDLYGSLSALLGIREVWAMFEVGLVYSQLRTPGLPSLLLPRPVRRDGLCGLF